MEDAPDADDIVKVAQKLFQRDKGAWSDVYQHALDDLEFQNPDVEGAQWDPADYQARIDTRRPALTIDQLSQFVHSVANDIRMNTPSINVLPSGNGSDEETAEIFKGLIRNIEYRSNADDVYDNASLSAIRSSLGFIQVDHDYVDEDGFEQELLIKRVVNPLACWIDADSIECDGRDARHGTLLDPILVSEFKKQYPGKDAVNFGEENVRTDYKDEDVINLAHFFILKDTARDISVDDNGKVVDYAEGMTRKRSVKKTIVERYKLSGKDELEKTTFPGRYIPLVPVYGEENWINGKRHILSLIRRAKDPQRMQNYWASLETELLQKMPQAPVMVAAGQIDDYIDDWRTPGKAAALRYKTHDIKGNVLPAPQRLEPPTIPTGIVNARREAIEDIKASMGLYNASIGARSNETSGVAIERRQQEGDVATFHFGDNLVRSITQVGRILVCAIPEIYDTPRVIRIVGIEGEPDEVGVNGESVKDQERAYDLTKGKYDVRVTTGASFTTKRQETAAVLSELIMKQPELAGIMGDIYFRNADFAGNEAMAERMEKWIEKNNPGMIEKDGEEAPDPQKMQMEQMIQAMQAELVDLKQKENNKQGELAIKQGDLQLKAAELELKKEELALKEAEAIGKFKIDSKKIDADMAAKRIDAKSTMSPEAQMADPELHDGGVSPLAAMMEQFAAASQNQAETIREGLTQIAIGQKQAAELIASGDAMVATALSKKREVFYNPDGSIAGVR